MRLRLGVSTQIDSASLWRLPTFGRAMNTRPKKRSLTLRGHRTSVSLEDDFWAAFRDIAEELQTPVNALAARIDEDRGTDCGLASAIRLFVLSHYRRTS